MKRSLVAAYSQLKSSRRREKDLGPETPTLHYYAPGYLDTVEIPENALIDSDGNPILDENGDFILV